MAEQKCGGASMQVRTHTKGFVRKALLTLDTFGTLREDGKKKKTTLSPFTIAPAVTFLHKRHESGELSARYAALHITLSCQQLCFSSFFPPLFFFPPFARYGLQYTDEVYITTNKTAIIPLVLLPPRRTCGSARHACERAKKKF